MSLARDLLQSWSRPPAESRRLSQEVLAALDTAMADPGRADAAQGLADAHTAYRRANLAIDAEKNPRISSMPAQYAEQLGASTDGGPAKEEDDIRDPDPNTDPGLLTAAEFAIDDPHFATPDPVAEDLEDSGDEGDGPEPPDVDGDGSDEAGEADAADDDGAAEDVRGDAFGEPADEEPDAREVSDSAPAQIPAEEAAPNRVPVSSEIPTPTVSYVSVASPFTGKILTTAEVEDTAAVEDTAPEPSPRATRPPRKMEQPDPDPEPPVRERIAESAARLFERARGVDTRTKVLAGAAAAALVLTLVAVISLSGNRGVPPRPSVAAPPAPTQTETAPDRTPATLSVYQVSSSCEDSDPTAPFQPADNRDASKAWVCKRINGLDGNVLNIRFGRTVVVTAITIVPGFDYVAPDGRDEWDQHRLVTGVTWRMANRMFPQQITPSRSGVTMKFDEVIASQMSLTITSSARARGGDRPGSGIAGLNSTDDSVDDTTAVSRIVITGYPLDPGK